MAKSTQNPVTPFAVIENGLVNVEKTREKFDEALNDYATEMEASEALVLGSLNALFDQHMGARIAQSSIIGAVIQDIGRQVPALADVSRYTALTKVVARVLKAHIENGDFNVVKGPLGGTGRSADCPKPEPKPAKTAK
jgi:hypothetical protein